MAFIFSVSVLFIIADTFGVRSQPITTFVSGMTFALMLCMNGFVNANDFERLHSLNGEQLLEVWHTECHRRCRDELVDHIHVACMSDPYKIVKKRSVNATSFLQYISEKTKTETIPQERSVFISKNQATSFLNTKVTRHRHIIHKRGIVQECCTGKACSWEEYAEYCHSHNRRRTSRVSVCYP